MSDPNSVKIEPNVTSAEEAHATSTVTSSSVTVTSAASAIMTSSSATGTVQRTRLATIARENQASLLGRKENLRKELEGLEAVLAATGMGNSSNGQNGLTLIHTNTSRNGGLDALQGLGDGFHDPLCAPPAPYIISAHLKSPRICKNIPSGIPWQT